MDHRIGPAKPRAPRTDDRLKKAQRLILAAARVRKFTSAHDLADNYGRALARLWGAVGVRTERCSGAPFGVTDAELVAGGPVAVEIIPVQPRPARPVARCSCGERLDARYPNLLNVPAADGKRCEWCRWEAKHHPSTLPTVDVFNPDPDAF